MHKYFAKTEYLGKSVTFLPECHSTNDIAQEMIKSSTAQEGTVVIASHQTHGRGQRGNHWESEAGKNAMFSIVLRPKRLELRYQFHLHLITSLALHQALTHLVGPGLSVKWPNDLYYLDSKLAGVLIESTVKGRNIENSVIGIGININQETFGPVNAVSLKSITQSEWEVNEVIEKVIIEFERCYDLYKQGHLAEIKAQYLKLLYRFDIEAQYRTGESIFTGKIKGIAENGQLLILSEKGLQSYDIKNIEFLLSL